MNRIPTPGARRQVHPSLLTLLDLGSPYVDLTFIKKLRRLHVVVYQTEDDATEPQERCERIRQLLADDPHLIRDLVPGVQVSATRGNQNLNHNLVVAETVRRETIRDAVLLLLRSHEHPPVSNDPPLDFSPQTAKIERHLKALDAALTHVRSAGLDPVKSWTHNLNLAVRQLWGDLTGAGVDSVAGAPCQAVELMASVIAELVHLLEQPRPRSRTDAERARGRNVVMEFPTKSVPPGPSGTALREVAADRRQERAPSPSAPEPPIAIAPPKPLPSRTAAAVAAGGRAPLPAPGPCRSQGPVEPAGEDEPENLLKAFASSRPEHPMTSFLSGYLRTVERLQEWASSLAPERLADEDPPESLLTDLDNSVFSLGTVRVVDLCSPEELQVLGALLRAQQECRQYLQDTVGLQPLHPEIGREAWAPGSARLDVVGHLPAFLEEQERKVAQVLSPGFEAGIEGRRRVVRRAKVLTYRLAPTPTILHAAPRFLENAAPWRVLLTGENLTPELGVTLRPEGGASAGSDLPGRVEAGTGSWLQVVFEPPAEPAPGRYRLVLTVGGREVGESDCTFQTHGAAPAAPSDGAASTPALPPAPPPPATAPNDAEPREPADTVPFVEALSFTRGLLRINGERLDQVQRVQVLEGDQGSTGEPKPAKLSAGYLELDWPEPPASSLISVQLVLRSEAPESVVRYAVQLDGGRSTSILSEEQP